MAALSGRKYSPCKIRDVFPEYSNLDSTENGAYQIGSSRSIGKRYEPVRISTAYFNNPPGSTNPGSNRKNMGMSSQKFPIRNIHKLLESPKRNARKRLDNLYDCSKPKKTFNPTTVGRDQALSRTKVAPRVSEVVVTSEKKKSVNVKTGLSKQVSENQRQSRLLQPGTIARSYVDRRSSLAPRNLYSKPVNHRFTLSVKKSEIKRPSNVPEESPQALETSGTSPKESGKLPGLNIPGKIDTHGGKKDSPLCSRCSSLLEDSVDTSVFLHTDDEAPEKVKVSSDPDLQDENKGALERPTVIVMQKETASRSNPDYAEPAQVAAQDGSYSEILSLQQRVPRRSLEKDESVLFKQTESACNRLGDDGQSIGGDKKTDYIFEMINSNREMLIEHKSRLDGSISQQEEHLKNLRLMLEDVKHKILESDIKLKRWSNSEKEELAVLVSQGVNGDSPKNDSEENSGGEKESKELEAAKPRKSRMSETKGKRIDNSGGDLSTESKEEENNVENIENEPPQRRRSARLAMKVAIKQGDLSLPVQQSTPVTGKKTAKASMAKTRPSTPSLITPARSGKWARRSERPLREYMVLKSAIKFLNTPDSRRYQIGSDEKVKIRDSIDKSSQEVQLTDKLLRELHDLYSTP